MASSRKRVFREHVDRARELLSKRIKDSASDDVNKTVDTMIAMGPLFSGDYRKYLSVTSLGQSMAPTKGRFNIDMIHDDIARVYGFESPGEPIELAIRQRLAQSLSIRLGPLISEDVRAVTISGIGNQMGAITATTHLLLLKLIPRDYARTLFVNSWHVILSVCLKSWCLDAEKDIFYINKGLLIAAVMEIADLWISYVRARTQNKYFRMDMVMTTAAQLIVSKVTSTTISTLHKDCIEVCINAK